MSENLLKFISTELFNLLLDLEKHFVKKSKGKIQELAVDFKNRVNEYVLELEKHKQKKIEQLKHDIELLESLGITQNSVLENKKLELSTLNSESVSKLEVK